MGARSPSLALLALLLCVLFSPAALATTVLVDAKDWRIAYIVGFYAPKKGYNILAIDSRSTGEEVVPYQLPKDEEIIIYESADPVIPNYEGFLRAHGFSNVRTVHVGSAYDLMFSLPRDWGVPVEGYVLVSDSAGEWVLAAGPLAYEKNYAILFLNNRTIDRIISSVPADSPVYVVGYKGRRVREAFPNAVYISTGSKAKDSIEIAREFNRDVPFSQVYVLSGMFLYLPAVPGDYPIWTGGGGKYPVIITYVDGMPSYVEDFLANPQIKAIVFVGPELDDQYTALHEKYIGEKLVLELYAVGYVNIPTRVPGKQYPQPAFILPTAEVKVVVESVDALAQGALYVRLRNQGDAAGYARITYVRLTCGESTMELRPGEAIFVDARDSVLVEYNVGQVLPQTNCDVYVEGYYGPDADRSIGEFNATFSIIPQSIEDRSSMDVTRLVYSPRLERFVIYVKNTGSVRAYVTAYLKGVLIDGVPTDLKSRQTAVAPGADAKLYAKAFLTDADILDNPTVHVVLRYGEQPNLPVKVLTKDLVLEKETLTDVVIEFLQENAPLVLGVLLVLIVLIVLVRRR